MIAVFFSAFLLTGSLLAAGEEAPWTIIKNLGLQSLNSVPIDFQLADMDETVVRLSDYKGKWIWLNFWATWCGPCAVEMPTLEGLYQEFKDSNLVVLGVSVDTAVGKKQIKNYLEEKEITFPVVHDSQGSAQSKYRATALPTIYLISPDWKLVGLFRGASNWESPSVIANVKKLLKFKKVDIDVPAGGSSDSSGAVSLPDDLIPPQLDFLSHVTTPKSKLFSQEMLSFQVNIRWKGDPKFYSIKVPRLTLPDQVKLLNVSSSSSSSDGEVISRYHYLLTFSTAGKYHLGPLVLSYRSAQGGKEQFSRHNGIDVEIAERTYFLPLVAGLLLSSILVFSFLFYRHRKKRVTVGKIGANDIDWSKKLNKIRKLKIEGKKEIFCTELINLNIELAQNRGEDFNEYQLSKQQIKFGGNLLTVQEITKLEKRIEQMTIQEDDE